MEKTRIIAALALLGLLVVGAVGFLKWFQSSRAADNAANQAAEQRQLAERRIREAQRLIEDGDYAGAEAQLAEVLALKSPPPEALLVAGEAAAEQGNVERALEYYGRVPDDGSRDSLAALFAAGSVHFYYGSLSAAEEIFRKLLVREPTHARGNDRLAELLDLEGRRWESLPYALETTRQGRATLQTLLFLADLRLIHIRPERMDEARANAPDDLGPELGLARLALFSGDRELAEERIRRVLDWRPDLLEARLRLGEILLDKSEEEFLRWHRELPAEAETHPELWVLRGLWARRRGQIPQAARCFAEAVRRNPNDRVGTYQLAQVLKQLGFAEEADQFLQRSLLLSDLWEKVETVIAAGDNAHPTPLVEIAGVLEKLGRSVEATAFRSEAAHRRGESRSMQEVGTHPVSADEIVDLWVRRDRNPSRTLDLTQFPLPDLGGATASGSDAAGSQYQARFTDLAAEAGLVFSYIPAPDETTEGKRIVELTGGGVGAVDFDRDGWPDVYFPQGGYLPRTDASPTDRLFHNRGGSFVDVTDLAGINAPEFGQGMAVGDFDQDGFPDLYVGNLGANQFYRNNGDGTFTEVATDIDVAGAEWTTSPILADLNNDGLPDLYVLNYLTGDEVYTKICKQPNMKPRVCAPGVFEAAQDRIYLNLGDGRFQEQTLDTGIVVADGKGLGILAADFEESGKLHLFIANDGVPNFYFVNESEPGSLAFFENALAAGLAVDGDGRAQACMGIAAADANQDEWLDMFVTNFDKEANTLYLGANGLFEDASARAGLKEPSYRLLGFGTQFVDGELDGLPDLVITNGHVDDFTDRGDPYRMRAQYLRNRGDGMFTEEFAETLGEFFAIEQFGRGMTRLDWNRDGRDDVAVSHLDTPASLITNTSETTGRYIAFRLVATESARDAIGTSIRVHDGDWVRMQQLTAGDGYLCSNERKLIFGLGDRARVPEVTVRWPSGRTESYRELEPDTEFTLIEGTGVALAVPR